MKESANDMKYRGEDGYNVISIRIKKETLSGLDTMAEKTGRSRNQLINQIIRDSLDNIRIVSE